MYSYWKVTKRTSKRVANWSTRRTKLNGEPAWLETSTRSYVIGAIGRQLFDRYLPRMHHSQMLTWFSFELNKLRVCSIGWFLSCLPPSKNHSSKNAFSSLLHLQNFQNFKKYVKTSKKKMITSKVCLFAMITLNSACFCRQSRKKGELSREKIRKDRNWTLED